MPRPFCFVAAFVAPASRRLVRAHLGLAPYRDLVSREGQPTIARQFHWRDASRDENRVPDGTPETRPRTLTSFNCAYGTRSLRPAFPPVEPAGYCHRPLRDQIPASVPPFTDPLRFQTPAL